MNVAIDFKKYHSEYSALYKQIVEKFNETNFSEIKNLCHDQIQRLRQTWTELGFDIEDLNQIYDPESFTYPYENRFQKLRNLGENFEYDNSY